MDGRYSTIVKKTRTYKYFITYYSESFSELKGHVHTNVSIPQQTPAIKTCGVLPVSSKPLQVSASWKVAATGRVLHPKDTTHCCKKWFGVSLILGRIFRLISNKKHAIEHTRMLAHSRRDSSLTAYYSNPAPNISIFSLPFIFSTVLMFLIKHVPL